MPWTFSCNLPLTATFKKLLSDLFGMLLCRHNVVFGRKLINQLLAASWRQVYFNSNHLSLVSLPWLLLL